MSNQSDVIKTDNLVVNLTRKPGCLLHLDITVSPEGTKAARAKAIKSVNKEISIPGFRKGKAPEAMVLQQFGKYVKQEWNEILLNTAFSEFLTKTQLYPFDSQKSIKRAEVKSVNAETGSQLILEYEAKPEIPIIDGSNLELKEIKRTPVTTDDIDETIRQIQFRHAEWSDVTDRPIQEGDFADLTIDSLDPPHHNICTELRFEVAAGRMSNWMRQLIIGRSVNDIVEGKSQMDENEKNVPEFKPTLCRLKINKIKTAALPPLDDELAKKVGLKSIDQLRPEVEKDLNRRADNDVQDQLRAELEDCILNQYQFDIPASIIEKQRSELLDKKVRELSNREENPEKMVEMISGIEHEVDKELNRAYRLFFITQKIAEANNIKVYENEIMQEMMRQIRLPPEQRFIDYGSSEEEARSKLFVNVLSQKVLDFLITKAKINKEQA